WSRTLLGLKPAEEILENRVDERAVGEGIDRPAILRPVGRLDAEDLSRKEAEGAGRPALDGRRGEQGRAVMPALQRPGRGGDSGQIAVEGREGVALAARGQPERRTKGRSGPARQRMIGRSTPGLRPADQR